MIRETKFKSSCRFFRLPCRFSFPSSILHSIFVIYNVSCKCYPASGAFLSGEFLSGTLYKPTTRNTREAKDFAHAKNLARKKRSASRVLTASNKKLDNKRPYLINPSSVVCVVSVASWFLQECVHSHQAWV